MLRIHEIKRSIGEDIDVIPRRIIKKLDVRGLEIKEFRLVRNRLMPGTKMRSGWSIPLISFRTYRAGMRKIRNLFTESMQGREVKLEKSSDMGIIPFHRGSCNAVPPGNSWFGPAACSRV
jgi:hypothetical protein